MTNLISGESARSSNLNGLRGKMFAILAYEFVGSNSGVRK